LFFNSIKQAAD